MLRQLQPLLNSRSPVCHRGRENKSFDPNAANDASNTAPDAALADESRRQGRNAAWFSQLVQPSQSFLCNQPICGRPVLSVTVGCNIHPLKAQARADHSIQYSTAFRWEAAELAAHAFLSGLAHKQVDDGRGRQTCQLDISHRTVEELLEDRVLDGRHHAP